MITLSTQQNDAVTEALEWYAANDAGLFRLFGYAGTGKTTIAKKIADLVRTASGRKVVFGAYTGKAASVLKSKGCKPASTIHRLTYKCIGEDTKGQPVFEFDGSGLSGRPALIIIDECSMVDRQMGSDLLSHGIPILVLGDPAQLPPISGAGYFTEAQPDVLLTEIHRQGDGSGIIDIATKVRCGERVPAGDYVESRVVGLRDLRNIDQLSFDQILCGTNNTRRGLNKQMREKLGHEGPLPVVGDKVICLRNDYKLGVMNGDLGVVQESETSWSEALRQLVIDFDGNVVETYAPTSAFLTPEVKVPQIHGQLMLDFGYAITVHKSQGSQWDNVLVHDESRVFREDAARWLYTGVTRAAKSVTVVQR